MPYLTKKRSDIPHESFKWRFTISAGIFEDHWKLIQLPDRLPMLFNLQNDISEQNDVALENVELTKKLMKKLGDWNLSLPHPLFLEGAEWKVRQRDLYDKRYEINQPQNK